MIFVEKVGNGQRNFADLAIIDLKVFKAKENEPVTNWHGFKIKFVKLHWVARSKETKLIIEDTFIHF